MKQRANTVGTEWLFMAMVALWALLWVPVSQGQTTSITPSGLNTHVSHGVGSHNYYITGGTRPGNGTNLFESFGDFSVGTHDAAVFLNDTHLPTTNILSRVTGGHVSNIFGQINTTNFPGANLYLINPAGVLFGPTATLNVSGSVHISTADYLRLADGLRFNAIPGPQDTFLSQAPVVAFGFLNPHPRPITVQDSQLSVAEGKRISLVGGDIRMTNGTLKAPRGQVLLASLAGRGEATVNPAAAQPGLTVTPHTPMGSITLKNNGLNPPPIIDVSGRSGGAVVMRGGHLVLNSVTVDAGTKGNGNQHGAGISIAATDSVTMNNSRLSTEMSGGNSIPQSGAGSISIAAPSVGLRRSALDASTVTFGSAGNIVINSRTVQLSSSRLSADGPNGLMEGEAGHIAIHAGRNFVSQNSTLSVTNDWETSGGTIDVDAERVTLVHSQISADDAHGNGGPIHMAAKDLMLTNSQISSIAYFGGHGGPIRLKAEHVTLGNSLIDSAGYNGGTIVVGAKNNMTLRNSRIDTETSSGFKAGSISLQAGGSLQLLNGTVLNSVGSGSPGDGGTVNLHAHQTILMDRSRVDTSGTGQTTLDDPIAGKIHLTAGNSVVLRNNSALTSNSQGHKAGGGGMILVDARNNIVVDNSRLSVNNSGDFIERPGQVTLSAGNDVVLTHGTSISANNDSAFSSPSNKVSIRAGRDVLVDASRISADGLGLVDSGGAIGITASRSVRVLDGSRLSVRGGFDGTGGTITIQTHEFRHDASSLLDVRGGGGSGFVIVRPLP